MQANKLEAIHNEAARIITGATKLCSIDRLHADLCWESLQSRRRKHRLLIFYKMVNKLTPDSLSGLVPPYINENNPYNLRNNDGIRHIYTRTNLYYNSFLLQLFETGIIYLKKSDKPILSKALKGS